MDRQFILHEITFIWNQEKARQNPLKHEGITFEQAAEAFFDPFLVVVDASRNYEPRDAIIGMDKGNYLLFVVHIQQENDYQNGIIRARGFILSLFVPTKNNAYLVTLTRGKCTLIKSAR